MKEADFLQELKELDLLKQAMSILEWDAQTGMPDAAQDYRSEVDGYLSGLYFDKATGPKIAEALDYFAEHPEELSEVGQAAYRLVKKEYELNQAVPKDVMTAYSQAVSKAHGAWSKARQANDFSLFRDALADNIRLTKDLIRYQKKEQANAYDVLLDQYEPSLTTAELDQVFHRLREGIMAIRATLAEKGQAPAKDLLARKMPKSGQQKFITKVAEELGYDFDRGRLDDTIHPFATGINHNDVRITTRWREKDFMTAIFGVIHEAGHGIYEQNIAEKYEYTPVHEGASMGIHESQSLFNELIIGGSRQFWEKQYPFFKECAAGVFDDLPFIDFYRGMKHSQSSLIRIEADSLTYPLHIIIRYEIEKELFNGTLTVDELPAVWKQKYQEYLGITPPDDLTGILQDVHWSGGMFGYFPSYALGYMYAAQLYHKMQETIDVAAVLATDDYSPIRKWLTEKVHRFGASKTPSEIILDATGETLNPQYLLDYLQELYFEVYQVQVSEHV